MKWKGRRSSVLFFYSRFCAEIWLGAQLFKLFGRIACRSGGSREAGKKLTFDTDCLGMAAFPAGLGPHGRCLESRLTFFIGLLLDQSDVLLQYGHAFKPPVSLVVAIELPMKLAFPGFRLGLSSSFKHREQPQID